jgi:phage regulator Rha-like protein
LKSQFATSSWGGRRKLPFAFTEHGVLMLSSVLNSKKAIEVNIQIMKIFVQMRRYALSENSANAQIAELRKLLMLHIENIDNKLSKHDKAIGKIMQVLNSLIEQPKKPKQIGFI